MKRRNFIQPLGYGSLAVAVGSAMPTYAPPENAVSKILVEKPQRLGDARDWFFEKRIGSFSVEPASQDHITQNLYLRLVNLPTNERCNTVMVIKPEIDPLPKKYVQTVLSLDKIQDKHKLTQIELNLNA